MSAALKTAELTGEALAFVRQGTPKPQVVSAPPQMEAMITPPPAAEVAPSSREEEEPTTERQPQSRPKVAAKTIAQPEPLVNLSFRVPTSLHNALKRASFEREMGREEPWTQQDIVAEAIAAWLKKQAT